MRGVRERLMVTFCLSSLCCPQISLRSPLLMAADLSPLSGSVSRLRTISFLLALLFLATTRHTSSESLGGRDLTSTPASWRKVENQSVMKISLKELV